MDVSLALRNTSKGMLRYHSNHKETPSEIKILFDELNPVPCISKIHVEKCISPNHGNTDRNLNNKENISNNNNEEESLYVTCYNGLSPPPKAKHSPIKKDIPVTVSSPVAPKPVLVEVCLSPEYGSSVKSIREYEMEYERKAQVAIAKKRKEFDDNSLKISRMMQEKLLIGEKQQNDKLKQLDQQTEKHLKDKMESQKQVQIIKDNHKHHSQMLDAKVAEVERKKQQQKEEEEERKRQEQLKQIVEKINTLTNVIFDQFSQLYNSCQHKDLYSPVAIEINYQVEVFKSKCESLHASMKNSIPTQDEIKILMKINEESRIRLEAIKLHIVEANKKGAEQEEARASEIAKAAELQRQQEQQQQEEEIPAGAVSQPSTSESSSIILTSEDVMVDALEEYTRLQGKLNKITESLKNFTENPQMKKHKFDLQKAVNTPINAISPESSYHLNDKLQRLNNLLAGQTVELAGKRINAKESPDGITFCKNITAKMIVKKGAEQVSSKHETAFAIASVAVGLWCYHPDIGDMILANFHAACPYTIPFIVSKQDNQSIERYHELLGYKVEDGVIENQDKFLKRMSGVMRLYAAILVSNPPRGSNKSHPHGLEFAWIWLSRVLNTDPLPDITASMIHDMLSVTGHALYEHYRNQFLKVLTCLIKEYVPKLKAVAVGGGPVSRLETFIENVIKNGGRTAPPEGLLPPNFI